MPKFRVFIHGINFHMPASSGTVSPHGFYVTAGVEAETSEAAELAAIALLRASPSLADMRNPADDPPRVTVEEIDEVSDWPTDWKGPLSGFLFYDDPEVDWRKAAKQPPAAP